MAQPWLWAPARPRRVPRAPCARRAHLQQHGVLARDLLPLEALRRQPRQLAAAARVATRRDAAATPLLLATLLVAVLAAARAAAALARLGAAPLVRRRRAWRVCHGAARGAAVWRVSGAPSVRAVLRARARAARRGVARAATAAAPGVRRDAAGQGRRGGAGPGRAARTRGRGAARARAQQQSCQKSEAGGFGGSSSEKGDGCGPPFFLFVVQEALTDRWMAEASTSLQRAPRTIERHNKRKIPSAAARAHARCRGAAA
jgi:hypothetical protein